MLFALYRSVSVGNVKTVIGRYPIIESLKDYLRVTNLPADVYNCMGINKEEIKCPIGCAPH